MDTDPPPVADPIRWTAAAYLAGVRPWGALVAQAAELLSRTSSVPESLVELASSGEEPRTGDARALTAKTLADLGLPAIDAGELSRLRVEAGLRDIADGHVAPVRGAHLLWAGREADGDPYEVLPDLIQLVDRWENHLDERVELEERIRTLARSAIRER